MRELTLSFSQAKIRPRWADVNVNKARQKVNSDLSEVENKPKKGKLHSSRQGILLQANRDKLSEEDRGALAS